MFRKLLVVFSIALTFMSVQPAFAAREDIEDLLITILREAIEEGQRSREETTPKPPESDGGVVRATDLIKVIPRDGAAIRDRPSARGKIITRGAEGMEGFTSLYVEPQPINNEGAQWYKAYFINNFGIDLCQIKYVQSLWNENSEEVWLNNLQYLYVNIRDAEQTVASDEWGIRESEMEKEFFAKFERGRPAPFKVGDIVNMSSGHRGRRADKTVVPIKLYQEPDKNSRTSILPVGAFIIDISGDRGGNLYLDPNFGSHLDMQDHFWNAIIDAKNRRLLGWADSDEHNFGPNNPLP